MIKQESIDRVLETVDIVDVVGSYIELKKNGANYKGLCPFHGEKTPSFIVSPGKQIYHCFGCHAGGNSVKFVMEYEKLNYPEAIEKLATENNLTLEYDNQHNSASVQNYRSLETLNNFFLKKLAPNSTPMRYLKERGIFDSSIEHFQIGYAPSSPEQLRFLDSQKVPLTDALKTGVAAIGDSGNPYAKFIERITFPIYSAKGKIIGFGGRTITNHPAKYINSPQTELFNKSRVLYAYNLAKDTILKKGEIILTEGYLDVIMLHQAGFTNAVASLGTALTPSHLPLIKRGEPRVIVAYDGDKAGHEAAFKASMLLYKKEFSGGVVLFQEGKDPADMVRNGEDNLLKSLLSKPIKFPEFIATTFTKKYNLNNPSEKQGAVNEIKNYVKDISPVFKEELLRECARVFNVKESFFTIRKKADDTVLRSNKEDILELKIIKTILEKEHFLDLVLDYVEPIVFKTHQDLFTELLRDPTSPRLQTVVLNDTIQILEEEDLKNNLRNLMIHSLEMKLKMVPRQNNLSFEEKTHLIKKYRLNILELKSGKWIET